MIILCLICPAFTSHRTLPHTSLHPPISHRLIYLGHLHHSIARLLLLSLALPAQSSTPTTSPHFVFCGGFLTPSTVYSSWRDKLLDHFPSSRFRFLQDPSGLQNQVSLLQASDILLTELRKSDQPTVLLGHSRGGAVALLATIRDPSLLHAVVLVDPVDDSDLSLIQSISEQGFQSLYLPPHLLISTPYGGRSSYYKKTTFTSTCAPVGRNAEALWRSLRGHADFQGILLDFPELGHLQLFDGNELTSLKNVCPSNEQLNPAQISEYKHFVYDIMLGFLDAADRELSNVSMEEIIYQVLDSDSRSRSLKFRWEVCNTIGKLRECKTDDILKAT